ncbi:hypothetical protein [Clostridium saccharoperbutylacetonicum]|uniref:hypothetical protein n=1 Tax=Clostridium saccharoperbutylacetonicum TaxID=36745 RepID=UPI0039EBD0E1
MGDNLETISKEEWYRSKERKPIKRKKHKGTKVFLLVFIVIIGISGIALFNYSNIVLEINKIKAIRYSEKEIEKHLSVPSTTKFPSFIFDSDDIKAKLHSED